MKQTGLIVSVLLAAVLLPLYAAATTPEERTVLDSFLNRIGGHGASELIATEVDATLGADGKDLFTVTTIGGKPGVKGSSVLAVTTGVNYYLNHYANINLTWNRLTTDLSGYELPAPAADDTHSCEADYRYYLNYCTFSYSMSTWTWERWEKEIDWMAMHGINMPLQIVGLDAVWRNLLVDHYGYTKDEANQFIAGPCFQAWWGMNNLEGWGGPNPDWWYDRQSELAKRIGDRERELGMQPVLPGFSGMVPSNFTEKTTINALTQGGWCGFQRPYILDPNTKEFADVSANYYAELERVMGRSEYYSMDPFHEGANTQGIDVPSAYRAIYDAMAAANGDSKWVIQYWGWSRAQYNVLDQVPHGKLIILDLFSDAHTHFGEYKDHEAVWCSLSNFGGRTGMFGRFNADIEGYFKMKAEHKNIKGIGATPEAIEQVPVLYDLLFELPWLSEKPDARAWMAEYAKSRYGADNSAAREAWELLRQSTLDYDGGLQGPHEAVICGRPALEINTVSTWGGSEIYYDTDKVVGAAYLLLESGLDGDNYSFDLTDVTRQALTDHGKSLLSTIKSAHEAGDQDRFAAGRDSLMALMKDIDRLLNTNENFMLGHWTQMARDIANESAVTTDADRDWLERDNARRLITTWGHRRGADHGGLRDYSYREWGGLMSDFYYARWHRWFDSGMADHDWFAIEDAWVNDLSKRYPNKPEGRTADVARELLTKYFPR